MVSLSNRGRSVALLTRQQQDISHASGRLLANSIAGGVRAERDARGGLPHHLPALCSFPVDFADDVITPHPTGGRFIPGAVHNQKSFMFLLSVNDDGITNLSTIDDSQKAIYRGQNSGERFGRETCLAYPHHMFHNTGSILGEIACSTLSRSGVRG